MASGNKDSHFLKKLSNFKFMLTWKFAELSMKCCDQEIKSVGNQTLDDNTSDHLQGEP